MNTLDIDDIRARLAEVGLTTEVNADLWDRVVIVPTAGESVVLRSKRHAEHHPVSGAIVAAWDSPWRIEHRGHTVPMRPSWVASVKVAVAWEASR